MRRATLEPRTESVNFKVTAAEWKRLERLATPENSPHQVAREMVQAALDCHSTLLTILAEVIAGRIETRNAFVAAGHLTAETANAIKTRANQEKRAGALAALVPKEKEPEP